MAILTQPQISSQHWYTSDGVPFHNIARADGNGSRPTSLSDARKLGLYCSVSELLGMFSKPGLIKWQIKKAITAALTLKRGPQESDEYFTNRILEEANAEVKAAADFGTRLHDAMEHFFEPAFTPQEKAARPLIPTDLLPYCQPVIEYIESKGFVFIETETIIVNQRYGFAGTLDVAFCYGPGAEAMPAMVRDRDYDGLRRLWLAGIGIGILDYKTRKTSAGVEVQAYDNQATQIVAYGVTYFATLFGVTEQEVVKRLYGANVFISSTEKGRYHVQSYTPVDFEIEWLRLVFVSAIWRLSNKYAPHEVEFPLFLQKHQPTRAMVRGITDIASADPMKLAHDVTLPAHSGDEIIDVTRLFESKDKQKKEAAAKRKAEKKAKLAQDAELVEATDEKKAFLEDKAAAVDELQTEIEQMEGTPTPTTGNAHDRSKSIKKRIPWSDVEDAFIRDRIAADVPCKLKAKVLNEQLHEGFEIRTEASYRAREVKLQKEIAERPPVPKPKAKRKVAKKAVKKTAKKVAKKTAKKAAKKSTKSKKK